MNNENVFYLIIAFIFYMTTQLGGLVPKSQDLVISFRLSEGETLPKLHLRALQIISEIFLLKDKTGQIKNLTGK